MGVGSFAIEFCGHRNNFTCANRSANEYGNSYGVNAEIKQRAASPFGSSESAPLGQRLHGTKRHMSH